MEFQSFLNKLHFASVITFFNKFVMMSKTFSVNSAVNSSCYADKIDSPMTNPLLSGLALLNSLGIMQESNKYRNDLSEAMFCREGCSFIDF